MRRVSRGRFLRSAAGAGIGAGALALVGCSSPETYNERDAGGSGGTEPVATARSEQAEEQEYEQQVEATATAVEVQEADQDQADSVLRGDSEALRQQNDWRRLRDAPGRGGGPRFGGSIRLVSPAPWYWAPITPAGAPPVSFAHVPVKCEGSESGYMARGEEDDDRLQNLWELQARELDPAERSDILEQIRAKRAEQVQSIHLVNPYGLFVRRRDVFNVGATYFAHNPMDYPKQFERAWKIVDGPGS